MPQLPASNQALTQKALGLPTPVWQLEEAGKDWRKHESLELIRGLSFTGVYRASLKSSQLTGRVTQRRHLRVCA